MSDPKPRAEREQIGRLYCCVMEEILIRDEILMAVLADGVAETPCMALQPFMQGRVVEEIAYLQLRMICELIALACLVAHGEVSGVQKADLRKEWNADKIIKKVGSLHPGFYPVPVRQGKADVMRTYCVWVSD